MPIRHGRNVGVYVNAKDLSGELNTITPHSEQELADVTTFGNLGHTYYPGLAKDSVAIEAIFASTESATFAALLQTDTGYAAMMPFGQAQGAPVYCTNECMLINNGIKSVVTDVNRVSISLDVDNYPWETGIMLTAGKETVTGSGSLNIVNCGSPSATTGGAAYLQIFTINVGTLQVSCYHSSTGAWVGEESVLVAFTLASTAGTERMAITSQIKQYVNTMYSSGSTASFAVALARY